MAIGMSGCAPSPEEAAVAAVQAACSGDGAAFLSRLTADSRLYWEGIGSLAPAPFGCSLAADDGVTGRVVAVREGLRMVAVEQPGKTVSLALVMEGGEWRVDLFFSEESLLFDEREEGR